MILGFSGSQADPSSPQVNWLRDRIRGASELHHGGCVGSDAIAHHLALLLGVPLIVVHPGDSCASKKMTLAQLRPSGLNHDRVRILPPKKNLDRNWDIAVVCDELAATPQQMQEVLRSGTWATVRYARQNTKPVAICYRDGRVE